MADWALNPTSHDTGGLVMGDWRTPVPHKLNLLKPMPASAVVAREQSPVP